MTVTREDLDCDGIDFDVTFDVRGEPTEYANDPENSLEIHFHSMLVHIGPENHVLIDNASEAIEALGNNLFTRASNLALEVYLVEISE